MSTEDKVSNLKAMAYIESVSVETLKDMVKELLLCQNARFIHFGGMSFTPSELTEVWKSL
jgi:hypothetical protein